MKDHIQLLQQFLLDELTDKQKEKIKELIKSNLEFEKQYHLIVALKKAVKLNILNDKIKYLQHVESSLPQLQTFIKHEKLSLERILLEMRKNLNIYTYLFPICLYKYFVISSRIGN